MLKDYRGQSKAGCPLDAQDLFHQCKPKYDIEKTIIAFMIGGIVVKT
jgi:hypothetical protein